MALTKILFSVNEYGSDGDLLVKGIYLHFGSTRVKVADSFEEFKEIVPHFQSMVSEIGEAYEGLV